MTTEPNRREFLRAGAAAALAAGVPMPTACGGLASPSRPAPTADACIFINLVGGPSQLDTWDPKPDAPSDVRGPFGTIPTRVPGLRFTDLFPKMAAMADRFSVVRSMHHTAAPIHETGFQLLNTGHLFRDSPEWPSVGAVVAHLRRPVGEGSEHPYQVIPKLDVNTGVNVSHGLGPAHLPVVPYVWKGFPGTPVSKPMTGDSFHPEFGSTGFGENCFWAAQMSWCECPFVVLNMYSTVFDAITWDCHADGGSLAATLADYRDVIAPTFDTAFTGILHYLESRGLLDRTLVVATGEFGRTPRPNSNGGRDHWPGCWTALVAGGGVKGGRVVGASDATASAPADRPVTPQELVATIFHAFGIPPTATIPGPGGSPVPVIDATPVLELF